MHGEYTRGGEEGGSKTIGGLTAKEIGKKIGKDEAYVVYRLRAGKVYRTTIDCGPLEFSKVLEISTMPSSDWIPFVNKAVSEDLSKRDIQRIKAKVEKNQKYDR